MTAKIPAKAQALLDAQVHYMLEQCSDTQLQALLERELDALLDTAEKLTLSEAVTRQMIKDTALTYAADLELHGAIPELVGDVARAVYASKLHDRTALRTLLSDAHFAQIVDKLLELKRARRQLVHAAVGNPVYAETAADLIYNGIKGYFGDGGPAKNIPGMQSVMKLGASVMSRTSLGAEGNLEENLKRYIHRSIQPLLRKSEHFLLEKMDDDKLRHFARQGWQHAKSQKVGALREVLESDDIEDFFVLGYEVWRDLRKTAYYREMIGVGIDGFFDKYGDVSLAELLDEMGMTREVLLAEAMRFAPHVTKVLRKKKLLEPIIRRHLEGFYHSAAARKLLKD